MRLVIEDAAGTRSIVPFTADAIVVGRGADVTFRLGARNVSRRHARFVLQAGAVFVEDLGSLTGTRVNGERITGRRRLRDGDLVQIGGYDLAAVEAAALEPGAPPPLPAPAQPRGEGRAAPPLPADPPPAAAEAPPGAARPAGPEPEPAARSVAVPAPEDPSPDTSRRGPRAAVVLAAGALALALGLAAGWAVGTATAPPAAHVTRP
jgi:predicted component of type VI protein secretion system